MDAMRFLIGYIRNYNREALDQASRAKWLAAPDCVPVQVQMGQLVKRELEIPRCGRAQNQRVGRHVVLPGDRTHASCGRADVGHK